MKTDYQVPQDAQSRYERMMVLVAHGRKLHSQVVFEALRGGAARLRQLFGLRAAAPQGYRTPAIGGHIHGKA